MDWALHFKGPQGGPWTLEYCWSYAEKETYTGWKFTIDNACNHALNRGDNVTVEYHLQLVQAVEEAIWAEEIRLQDEVLDAKCSIDEATYQLQLRHQDKATWGLADYQHKKRLHQYMLDQEHETRRRATYYKQIE